MVAQIQQREPDYMFISELSKIPGAKKYRTSMRDVLQAGDELFQSVIPQIQSLVLSAADSAGELIFSQRERVARQASDLVMGLFATPDGRVFDDDGVTALTPFGQMLNEFYVRVVLEAIYTQRNWLQKNLPDDLFNWLAGQNFSINLTEADNPFLRRAGEADDAFLARMQDLRVFHRNPLAELDPNRQWVPMHQWTDSNGYRLSNRIWRIQGGQLAGVGPNTAAKIDAMINDGFAEGQSALRLSRQLEQFLLPSRANIRTNKPYGTNASFDAMRLARTEIARAGNHASAVSAYLNPYVNTIDVARSPNGDPLCPICPQHATIGIDGSRLRPAYSVNAMNYPVYHPHCKCHTRPNVTDNPETVTLRLRAVMEDARVNTFPPAVTPAAIDNFTNMLLHRALGTIVGQWRGQLPLLGF